jgi:predicted alpha/beta hydrolase family esterase
MLFGYNANVAFQSSTAGVLEQAHNLLNRVRMKRRRDQAEHRPLIFIAHSLGGIVVKRVRSMPETGVFPFHIR